MPKVFFVVFRYLSIAIVWVAAVVVNILMADCLYTIFLPLHLSLPFSVGFIVILLLLTCVWAFTIAIHEFGHYAAARLQGMKVIEIRLGWLQLAARRRGFRLKLDRKRYHARGWVKAIASDERNLLRQMIILGLGGPMINIIIGILCAILGLAITASEHPGLASAFYCLALANLYAGLANLLPIGKKMPTDGSRLYHWIFESRKDPANLAIHRLMALSIKGRRARDYAREEIELLTESTQATQRFLGGWILMRGAMDAGNMEAARQIFDEYGTAYAALEKKERESVDGLWKFFLHENAYLRALAQESSFDAHQELDAPGRESIPHHMRLRLQAAMHLADNSINEARECLKQARNEVEDHYDAGTRLEERDLLDKLSSVIDPSQSVTQ